MTFEKNIKLVIADLDGTLLNSEGKLSPRTKDVVNKLKEKGILFSFASGRNKVIMKDFIDELEIDQPYLSDNGANIYKKDELIKSYSFDKSYNNFILQTLVKENIPFNAYSDKGAYYYSVSPFLEKVRKRFIGKAKINDYVDRDYSNENFYKITLDSVFNDHMSLVEDIINNKCRDISFKRSEDTFYTIVGKGIDKGFTCLTICEMLNIDPKDLMVMGDNNNDVSMFKVAGVSVCPTNASEDIKKQVTYICGNNNEEGAIKFLEEFFNLQE